MDITNAQFWDVPNTGGLPTFGYAELLAQLTADLPSGNSPNIGKGALVRGSTQSIPNLLAQFITWDKVDYDDLGFTDIGGANPERLVIPDVDPPIVKVVVGGFFAWQPNVSGNVRGIETRYNFNASGNLFPAGTNLFIGVGGDPAFGERLTLISGAQEVSAADQFTIGAFQDSGAGLNINTPMGYIRVIE